MSTLVRASELAGRVVVTFAGEDVAQIKDIVYAANGGQIGSFTLAGRGLFAGPLKVALPWAAVAGLGPDAVMIESEAVLVPLAEAFESSDGPVASGKADILKSEVLTDAGTSLGRVSDVIIGIGESQGGQADVVGYQIDPVESLGRGKLPLLIPLPDTLSASGEHLMVPAAAANYLTDNLAGFGSAIDAFRSQLGGVS
ncbi:PRC-barrel domain-containing protein [Nakamurella sp. PAMC28650]|jgi:sporulation protein YlmC with PRC-barrel domain|uniref:PRC-barrel domain-containing protein n=1 Tax=Nakamurella sp. PAMC28650 TaxID=2762325 RepID=UPI00164E6AE3|nr:PRC-barrel domain-containing protein [Nakamurella sp. PAMC28650]QNK81905.1 PRC-barrel domain-containing protein [Nakamurella sp. PAMC28650]